MEPDDDAAEWITSERIAAWRALGYPAETIYDEVLAQIAAGHPEPAFIAQVVLGHMESRAWEGA